MAELKRKYSKFERNERIVPTPYAVTGHPSIQELMDVQSTGPITNIADLHGDFWPEEESIEDFVETLHKWRGHRSSGPGE